MEITPELLEHIKRLPRHEQAEILRLTDLLTRARQVESARENFLPFIQWMKEDYVVSAHHKEITNVFDRVLSGELKRVIINLPPRVGKSTISSLYLPAYFMGKKPKQSIIEATHTQSFSTEWGMKVRDLVNTDRYREIFPEIKLKADARAASHWLTSSGGSYFAVGVGGTMVGRDADLIVIDDPHDENDGKMAAYKPDIFKTAYDWYLAGPRQRLMPHTAIVIVMTRWGVRDLTGAVVGRAIETGQINDWTVIEFPAIFPSGKHIFPENFSLKYWQDVKTEYPASYWNSVYQQNPTSEEAALVKREWWKPWEGRPPECEYILQSWDTAYLKTQRSDFCACTTWGVFSTTGPEGQKVPAVILLKSYKERLEFPELKSKAKQFYKEDKPDTVLIEAKAAGAPLISEMRMAGIPVSSYTPTRGNDKIVRVNSITDIFKSGWVYFLPGKENEEVIEQFAAFPVTDHDDLVDSATQALMRFRLGGLIKTQTDHDYEDDDEPPRRNVKYY